MGIFDRKAKRLLPPDAAYSLAEFGRSEFDRMTSPTPGTQTVQLLVALSSGPLQQNQDQVVQELYELGMRTGGWTLVGASYAVRDFYQDKHGSPEFEELRDARLRFIHDLNLPNIHTLIATGDILRWNELFPDA